MVSTIAPSALRVGQKFIFFLYVLCAYQFFHRVFIPLSSAVYIWYVKVFLIYSLMSRGEKKNIWSQLEWGTTWVVTKWLVTSSPRGWDGRMKVWRNADRVDVENRSRRQERISSTAEWRAVGSDKVSPHAEDWGNFSLFILAREEICFPSGTQWDGNEWGEGEQKNVPLRWLSCLLEKLSGSTAAIVAKFQAGNSQREIRWKLGFVLWVALTNCPVNWSLTSDLRAS